MEEGTGSCRYPPSCPRREDLLHDSVIEGILAFAGGTANEIERVVAEEDPGIRQRACDWIERALPGTPAERGGAHQPRLPEDGQAVDDYVGRIVVPPVPR